MFNYDNRGELCQSGSQQYVTKNSMLLLSYAGYNYLCFQYDIIQEDLNYQNEQFANLYNDQQQLQTQFDSLQSENEKLKDSIQSLNQKVLFFLLLRYQQIGYRASLHVTVP